MQDKLDPVTLAIAATVVGALAGVGALLRSTKELTARALLSAAINSGALGGGLAMLLFSYFKDNTWFLLGLCLLAGLGGMTLVGFILTLFRQGGVNVDVKINKKHRDEEDSDDTEA